MKIIYITPGSGGTFYCENCLRDVHLVRALRDQGQDVAIAPMYLPVFGDSPDVTTDAPVFFGGINVYLQQKMGIFRHSPRWLDQLLDAKWLLSLVARKASSTRACGLGAMTLSMLHGERGQQAKEVTRIIDWLHTEKPDIIHLSNALLSGLASPLKNALGCRIVCSLQDEDVWLDALDEPYPMQCWQAIHDNAAAIDHFAPVSHYYSNTMQQRLDLPQTMFTVTPVGVDIPPKNLVSSLPENPPVVGFLARECKAMGLDILVDSFLELRNQPNLQNTRLMITGGYTGDDRAFRRQLQRLITAAGAAADVTFLDDFTDEGRQRFLAGLSVLSVPVRKGEACGTYALEAMAAGVPVVQPRLGAFPETVGATGGGLCYEPNTPAVLSNALASLLNDRPRLQKSEPRHAPP